MTIQGKEFHPRTKIQVNALNECVDLTLNGYFIMFSASNYLPWCIKLHNFKNMRTLVIWIGETYWMLCEREKILKSEGKKL